MRTATRAAAAALAALLLLPGDGAPQSPDRLRLTPPGGAPREFSLVRHLGYPAVPSAALEAAGWRVEGAGERFLATLPGGTRLEIHPGKPFVRLDSAWAQLVSAPYRSGDTLYLPLQLFSDLLPDRLPRLYRARGSHDLLLSDTLATAARRREPVAPAGPVDGERDDGVRVVIIDPGHGGVDPGTLGRRRTREKDVTLAIGRALARALEGDPKLEVHLTRDEDRLVPLWERGEIASRLKGNRPGIFLSIHANAANRREVRGVETYFLAEARTEHEVRVAALENSARDLERGLGAGPAQGDLGVILSDLLNNDFQHWSSELAGRIQAGLTRIHPGTDRGVKQAPLAVLTNAMMPSALVEVGFITNADDEALLTDPGYHRDVADELAKAVRDFFRIYPPGTAQGRGSR